MIYSEGASNNAGQKLRARRERLGLRYRDVEQGSRAIATRRNDEQFQIGISRLADIESKGTVPSFYRLYSLAAIYRLDFHTLLEWYGINLESLATDAASVPHARTVPLDDTPTDPAFLLPASSLNNWPEQANRTFFFKRQLKGWGKVPASLLNSLDFSSYRYAFLGTEDWFMYPLLRPGSFLQIDERLRKISTAGWTSIWQRPIYLVEHREGFRCGWCSVREQQLIMQPYPTSGSIAEIYHLPDEAEIIGQVVGMATRLGLVRRRHKHSVEDQE